MKLKNGLLSLGLVLATLAPFACGHFHEVFEDGKTYSYSASTRATLAGDKSLVTDFKYTVEVTPITKYKLLFKMKNIEVISSEDLVIPQPILDQLESPVEVTLSSDERLQSLKMENHLEAWISNLKKMQVTRFLVNLSIVRPRHPRHQQRNELKLGLGIEMNKELKNDEDTIFGVCKTMTKLTEKEPGSSSSEEEDVEDQHCPGKGSKTYIIRKSIDTKSCNDEHEFLRDHGSILSSKMTLCGTNPRDLTLISVVSTARHSDVGSLKEKYILHHKRRAIQSTSRNHDMETHPNLKFLERHYQPGSHHGPLSLPGISSASRWLKDRMEKVLASMGIKIHGRVRELDDRVPKFRACMISHGVPNAMVVDPVTNSTGYQFHNFQWNSKFQKVFPVAFLLPRETNHVAAAVKCGVLSNIHLVANSGGHSYDNICWGTNATLIIDFQEMNRVEVEGTGKNAVAVLHPGALLGPATAKLWSLAKVGIPVGNCLTVGVGGHGLGGGIGLFSMVYGLLIDNILEYEIIDATGEIRIASAKENSDLFWALRGIGPGYIGIVTRLKIKTFQADKMQISVVKLIYSVKDFAKVATVTQDWIEWTRVNEPKVGTIAMAYSDDWDAKNSVTPGGSEPGIIIASLHIYDPDVNPQSNATFLKKMIEMFPTPEKKLIFFPNYLATHFATGYSPVILPTSNTPALAQAPSPFPPEAFILSLFNKMSKPLAIPRYFKAKSHFVKRKLTTQEINKLADIMQTIPKNRAGLLISTEHGAIKDVSSDAAAYVHRDVAIDFRVHVEATPKDGDINEAIEWMDKFWAAMASFDGNQTYQNYPDLEVPNYLERYYGKNLPKLIAAKKKWDPTNYFVNDQSLPLTMETDNTDIARKLPGFRICLQNHQALSSQLFDPISDPDYYSALNVQWNSRIQKIFPIAYYLPLEAKDVQAVVKCGVELGIHVIPNSGGHSYESIGWGTNSTIVIDFREMTKVEVEDNGKVAKIQPGALVGPVNAQLWELSKVAIPMGNCLTVGLGGHAIGGGVGFFTAMYGLTIDRVLEYEIVDAKGDLVIASETRNPDLFWTLRGVGAGYVGIATGFKLKTFNAGNIQISVVRLVYYIKDFVNVMGKFQEWMKWTSKNDPSIFSTATITNDNWSSNYPATAAGPIGGIIITTLHIHDPDIPTSGSNATFLAKIDEIFPKGEKMKVASYPSYLEFAYASGYAPVRMNITVKSKETNVRSSGSRSLSSIPTFIQKTVEIGHLDSPLLDEAIEFAVKHHIFHGPSAVAANPASLSPRVTIPEKFILAKLMMMKKEIAMPRYFRAKSLFIKRLVTKEEFQKLGEVLTRIPNNKNWVLINSELGAVQTKKYNDTSYVHRDSLIDISVHVEASENEGDVHDAETWLRDFWTELQPLDGGETYQNYPDLEVKDFLQRHYGRNLNRLLQSKRKWDPTNYFRNQLSIPVDA